ncbi:MULTISPECIES: universal stress protein [Cysteiniphilum]|uniref:universal stress protein n=1 Tax=Cysteiniphilum TaxID=2056696 RepID=UPI00177E1056|nr:MULTISPECIES: universal stress protein [Cysteiniphilum]
MDNLQNKPLRVLYALDIYEKHKCIIDEASLRLFPQNTEFHIITVIPKVLDTTGFLIGVINELNQNQLDAAKSKLMQLVSPLETQYHFASAVIIDNSVVSAISEYVDHQHIDCVIINGQKHGLWERHVTGNQEKIVGMLDCDVIISKKSYLNRINKQVQKKRELIH